MLTASGAIALTHEDVLKSKVPTILFKHHTDLDDTIIIPRINGIITIVGGSLSHASIVAREYNKACLVDCQGLKIDLEKKGIEIGGKFYPAGTNVILDGTTGGVYLKW